MTSYNHGHKILVEVFIAISEDARQDASHVGFSTRDICPVVADPDRAAHTTIYIHLAGRSRFARGLLEQLRRPGDKARRDRPHRVVIPHLGAMPLGVFCVRGLGIRQEHERGAADDADDQAQSLVRRVSLSLY